MVKITLGGMELPIKPTPLVHLAEALPHLIDGPESPAGAKALARAVFYGIRRAGGEVTEEFVSDNIDYTNVQEVADTFAKVNNLERKAAGEGEAGAGAAS
jgi:hypothetical protein